MRHYLLYLIALFTLWGCTAPSINEYTLLTTPTVTQDKTPLSPKNLSVALSKSVASLSGKNIIYLHENGETGAYLYSRWSDTPSVMLQRSLLTSLYAQGVFASLSPSSSIAKSDWMLESDLDAFTHRISNDKSDGYIDITYRLIDTQSKRPIAAKRFVISSPSTSTDAKGGINALKSSEHELNRQCIAWLKTIAKEIK
jgi:cholesterol transport system auxiliary component